MMQENNRPGMFATVGEVATRFMLWAVIALLFVTIAALFAGYAAHIIAYLFMTGWDEAGQWM